MQPTAEQRALLVIAKRPQSGQAKTRLCPPCSAEQAAALYECFLRDTLDVARAVPNVARLVLYLPHHADGYFRELAPDFDLLGQVGDSLGERLDNALQDRLGHGFRQVVIVDSDSPTLPPAYLERAFALLEEAEVVLGPTDDGGYYLIGATRPQPRLLREVQMSTPDVLSDTLRIAQQERQRVALLPHWYDVDTITDLRRLHRELGHHSNGLARYTRDFLRREFLSL